MYVYIYTYIYIYIYVELIEIFPNLILKFTMKNLYGYATSVVKYAN